MMTKIYRHNLFSLLMVALLLVGASSCQKERFVIDTPDEEQKGVTPSYGSTYMSLSLRTGGGSDKSEDQDYNYQGDWAGTDDITSFAVYVVSEDRDEIHCIYSNKIVVTPGEYYWDANSERAKRDDVLDPNVQTWKNNVLTLKPWKTSPGKKTIYAFLNPPAEYIKYLEPTLGNKGQFEARVKEPIPYQGKAGLTYPDTDAPKLGGFRPDPNIAKKVLYKDVSGDALTPGNINMSEGSFGELKDDGFDSRLFDLTNNPSGGKPTNGFYKYSDHIMCSGIKEYFAVADNISESEVAQNRENLAVVSVRRVLAQAVVSWDKSIIGKGLKGDPEKAKMKLMGIYYQVLNFEPTFYPIAERTNSEWFNIKNTKSPSYGQLTPSGLIDFTTYHPHEERNNRNNRFDPATLDYERFFRNSIPVNKSQVMPPSNDNDLTMQQLFRRKVIIGMWNVEDGENFTNIPSYPYETPTVHWGGCYLTETTHPWGAGEDSGYRKGNTPFFAVVASFAINSLPWSPQTKKQIQDLLADVAKQKANEMGDREQRLADLIAARDADPLNAEIKAKQAEVDAAKAIRPITKESRALVSKLNAELKALKKKLKDKYPDIPILEKEIKQINEKYSRKEYDAGDDVTPLTYAHGINRIYYSLGTQKFYLNYHDIPVANRGGNHQLKTTDDWYINLTNAIPAGASIPKAKQDLLNKFSGVLNGTIQAEKLTPDEQRAMDFYLYGRVAPDLVTAFNGTSKYDHIDLRLGYVEDYTAKHKDKVVNYEIMTRYRGVNKDGQPGDYMQNTRLLMVYYAWVNPSTNNNRTWYSSPVLRNNIYHMHITGFTKMGLSGIPFVKKPDDPRFSFLHNIDPDEKVPSKDEYLPIQDPYMNVQVTNVGWGIHSYKKQF